MIDHIVMLDKKYVNIVEWRRCFATFRRRFGNIFPAAASASSAALGADWAAWAAWHSGAGISLANAGA